MSIAVAYGPDVTVPCKVTVTNNTTIANSVLQPVKARHKIKSPTPMVPEKLHVRNYYIIWKVRVRWVENHLHNPVANFLKCSVFMQVWYWLQMPKMNEKIQRLKCGSPDNTPVYCQECQINLMADSFRLVTLFFNFIRSLYSFEMN